jgi:transcriptional regulator NrdR family protein
MGKICKRHGEKESFDERKLYASIYYPAREADYSEQEAEDLAEQIVDEIKEWIDDHEDNVFTAKELEQEVNDRLEAVDPDVAFLYETHLDLS